MGKERRVNRQLKEQSHELHYLFRHAHKSTLECYFGQLFQNFGMHIMPPFRSENDLTSVLSTLPVPGKVGGTLLSLRYHLVPF